MSQAFGQYIRACREAKNRKGKGFSLRQVAKVMEVQPCYLSKIELGQVAPPAEPRVVQLAHILGEDEDELLARAGKLSTDLVNIINKRPRLMAAAIRKMQSLTDEELARLVMGIHVAAPSDDEEHGGELPGSGCLSDIRG